MASRRRVLLSGLSAAATAGIGVLSYQSVMGGDEGDVPDGDAGDVGPSEAGGPKQEDDGALEQLDEDVYRGAADPIEVSRELDIDGDPDREYLGDDRFRIVLARSGADNAPRDTATVSFDWFVEQEAIEVASDAVEAEIESQIDDGIGVKPGKQDYHDGLFVRVVFWDPHEDADWAPPESDKTIAEIAPVTPQEVTVTYTFQDYSRTETYPVLLEDNAPAGIVLD